jgi:hypothetical protein
VVDKHLIPVVHQSRLGFHGLAPTPNAFPWLALGSHSTTTPGPKLTHRYSRRATYGRLITTNPATAYYTHDTSSTNPHHVDRNTSPDSQTRRHTGNGGCRPVNLND